MLRIIELRSHEMEKLTLSKSGIMVDLRPLHLTAYGYQVLQALNMRLKCSVEEFEKVSNALEELSFVPEVKDQSGREEFSSPPHVSASLSEYILRLVESRKPEEAAEL